jgi:hypothetical protein
MIPGKTAQIIKLFSILKVQRYFKVGSIIADSDMTLTNKVIMRILYNIILVFLYVHITGCFFWYVIDTKQKTDWLPAYDYIDGSQTVMYRKKDGTDQTWHY